MHFQTDMIAVIILALSSKQASAFTLPTITKNANLYPRLHQHITNDAAFFHAKVSCPRVHFKSCQDSLFGSTSSPEEEDTIDPKETPNANNNRLDSILSRLTSGFPIFVLSSAILGIICPPTLTWVNKGDLIPLMLASVMLSMGMTLQTDNFTRVISPASIRS